MTAAGGNVAISKTVLAVAGVVVIALIVGAGLIGHYAFPNNPDDDNPSITTEAPPLTTVTPPLSLTDFRLPTSLVPIHYTVELTPHINGNFSIEGHIKVEISVMEATSNITIHMADIVTHNDTIKVSSTKMNPGSEVVVSKHTYDPSREWYVGFLEEELSEGDEILLEMQFTGLLNDQLRGFYRSSYNDENGTVRALATTQFQATDARRAFPCFDEPALKANFTISLARENTMTTISNMPIATTTDIINRPGWQWDRYETTVAMSTYLVAFIVSDFVYLNTTAGDTDFNVWARPAAIDQAKYALEIGPETLTFFENYFDIPYPLPKQDMIAIPDFSAGAMENWGLITYRETAMLYDPLVSPASSKQRVGVVIVHELAHQWFGNLVTPSWWTDLWLNEGFASYMEYVGLENAEPTWKMMEQFLVADLHSVMAIDSLESSHPVSIPVGHPNEIDEIFDRISYSKGASIIRMMQHFLTEEIFKKGLTNYLNNFSYGATEQDDLWEFLTNATNEGDLLVTVKEIMDTWTLQMGYPVLNVTRSEDGESATVSQSRFLLVDNENPTDSNNYMWWIPITHTNANTPDFTNTKPTLWMNKEESEVTVDGLPTKDSWVIFNIQETGYYRVNYDQENWQALIDQLGNEHEIINVNNRAQLIDDAMALARAGQLSYDIALNVSSYLTAEVEYIPWQAAVNSFQYLEKMMTGKPAHESLKQYISSLVVPLYESVGFDDNLNDDHLVQYKRTLAVALACGFQHTNCTNNAVQLYEEWTTNGTYVYPNLKTTIFCTAIAEGGENEWKAAWEQYLVSNVAVEKDQILSALGCSRDVKILSRYLDWTFTEEMGIRKQDARTAFRAVAGNVIGNTLAMNYLKYNWQHILDYFGSVTMLGDLLAYVSDGFNTLEQKQELETFNEKVSDALGTATRALEQAIESTGNNIAWIDNNYDTIVYWLEANGYPTI